MSDPIEDDDMSAPQREAICKAWDLLCEHFDRVLLVVDFETEGEGGKREDAHEGFWHGGSLSAIGMAAYAQQKLLNTGSKTYEP